MLKNSFDPQITAKIIQFIKMHSVSHNAFVYFIYLNIRTASQEPRIALVGLRDSLRLRQTF